MAVVNITLLFKNKNISINPRWLVKQINAWYIIRSQILQKIERNDTTIIGYHSPVAACSNLKRVITFLQ